MSTRTRWMQSRDWLLWGALGCALVSTAHAEYTLATATHVNEYVALAVPGALDLYVIRALQVRRDVFAAVLVMVAANVTSHLLVAGVLPVHWSVIAAVGALAPLLLWRVHALGHAGTAAPEASAVPGAPASAVQGAVNAPEYGPHLGGCTCGCGAPGDDDGPDAEPLTVPEEWVQDEVHPGADAETDWEAKSLIHLHLNAGDTAYLGSARAYLDGCTEENRTPSVRGLKEFAGVGQARAERLLKHLRGAAS